MFTNLKNKLLEEVKASPQKFQQLAQAAQAAVSTSSPTTTAADLVHRSDSFFSIAEEDTPQNSPLKASNHGIDFTRISSSPLGSSDSSNARRLSNSSHASDASFRLPTYDTTVHHLQSDLDMSASEVEDTLVVPSSQFDLLQQEDLVIAYKHVLSQYEKYKLKYIKIVKGYKALERDNINAKALLVETQDKAIRRISELREQCVLEQQAKAHLEESLRLDIDDMQYKIKSYETKFKFLEDNNDNGNISISPNSFSTNLSELKTDTTNLISFRETENQIKNYNSEPHNHETVKFENLLSHCHQELEKQNNDLLTQNQEISDLLNQLSDSSLIIKELKKREEENALLLAQNKLMIHTELENKEIEVKELQKKLVTVENQLQKFHSENVELKRQLVELTSSQSNFKEIRQDFEAKNIANQHILNEVNTKLKEKDEEVKHLLRSFEEKINSLVNEHQTEKVILKEEYTKQENKLIAQLATIKYQLNIEKSGKTLLQEQIAMLTEKENNLIQEKNQTTELLNVSQKKNEQLLMFDEQLGLKFRELQTELLQVRESKSLCLKEITDLNAQIQNLKLINENIKEFGNLPVNGVEEERKAIMTQVEDLRRKNLELDTLICQKNEDIRLLQTNIENSEHNMKSLQLMLSKQIKFGETIENEKNELKLQVTNALNEIERMEQELRVVRKSHSDIEIENQNLEKSIKNLKKVTIENQDKNAELNRMYMTANENVILLEEKCNQVKNDLDEEIQSKKSLKLYLKKVNCGLANENAESKLELETVTKMCNQLELNITKFETQHKDDIETIRKLTEKVSQLVEDNSVNLNAKEILEHDVRSLQAKYENSKNEIHAIVNSNENFEEKLHKLEKEKDLLSLENKQYKELDIDEEKIKGLKNCNFILESKLKDINNQFVKELETKQVMHAELNQLQFENQDLKEHLNTMQINLQKITELQKDSLLQNDINKMKTEIEILSEENKAYVRQIHDLNSENELRLVELNDSLRRTNDEKQSLKENATDIEKKLYVFEDIKMENIYLKKLVDQLRVNREQNKLEKSSFESQMIRIRPQLQLPGLLNVEGNRQNVSTEDDTLNIEHVALNNQFEELESLFHTKGQEIKHMNKEHFDIAQHISNDTAGSKSIFEKVKELDPCLTAEIVLSKKSSIEDLKLGLQTSSYIEELKEANKNLQCQLEKIKQENYEKIRELNIEINVLNKNLRDSKTLSSKNQRQISLENPETNDIEFSGTLQEFERIKKNRDELESKIEKIMHEVQNVSNRNLFLEQKCENFLILEQSNERLKLTNDKLSRQLDETLASVHYNENISANTEFEYLRNIMLQYLTGNTSGNSPTLVKVIAAVLKFSPQQTQVVIEKEQQRHSLLGHLNTLL